MAGIHFTTPGSWVPTSLWWCRTNVQLTCPLMLSPPWGMPPSFSKTSMSIHPVEMPIVLMNEKQTNLGFQMSCFFPPFWRYLWIKHNQQYDIKEGPINNFMPKIESKIDAAFWVPRRSTAYLIHGTDISYHTTPSWLTVCNECIGLIFWK